ncbi:MAG: efflux RND transporter periplasmic adaptor subunit [Roseiarcus sp.]|jgi:RND family efflux transporter MFP subunit
MSRRLIWIGLASALTLAGCGQRPSPPPDVRPVRTVTVERRAVADTQKLSGVIRAQDEVNLAFRLDGRMIERKVQVGDKVTPGQKIASLDPQNQQNALRSAEAALSAAQGQLTQARNAFDRQQTLLGQGFTTRALYDQAQQALQSAQAQVDSTQAQLNSARDQLGYTSLRADAGGVVTATGAEPGEVVHAGQMIAKIARQGGRDAVFDVPQLAFRIAPDDPQVRVTLTDDPSVTAIGRVREVSPEADPATHTYSVKIGLIDPPPAMRLGATVTGALELAPAKQIELPASALTETAGKPAVWIVDPVGLTVSLRAIEVARDDPASVVVAGGLQPGEIVVTAGVQSLHPGQKVRLLGGAS